MSGPAPDDKAFRRRVRRARLGLRLARGAGRKKRGWLDRLLTRLLRRLTAPRDAARDFMRDDLVDAGVAFDPRELDRYQRAGDDPLTRR